MIGSRLGPYQVVDKVGAGGMGEVYRARDTRLDRVVAIKVLPADATNDADRRQRFEREARAVAAFSHPNVCAVFDVGHEGDVTFLVMEYLDGETLAARLARRGARTFLASRAASHGLATSSPTPIGTGRGDTIESVGGGHGLPIADAIRIATELAEALAAAHRAGIVHRDLKPGNIMLTRTGVKVLDFGLARMIGREAGDAAATMLAAPLTGAGMLLGTVPYMSPEQVEGKEVDARSDIFALGSVIYEMVTGRRAFEGASQASLIAAILDRQPAPISDVQPLAPAGLDRIVHTCLEKDPDDRWQHASDIARQLRWLATESEPRRDASAAPAPVSETAAAAPTASQRPRTLGWPLASVGVAVLALAGYVVTEGLIRRFAAPADTAASAGAIQFALSVPNVTLTNARVSPDGRSLALTGATREQPLSLWVKRLDRPQAERIAVPGFTGGTVWSPDGRELAARTTRGLVAIHLDTGVVRSLTPESFELNSWGSAGTIIGERADSLRFLDTTTGQLADPGNIFSISSEFLPDGRRFLSTGRDKETGNPDGVYLSSVDAPTVRRKVLDGRSIVAHANGHLLFVRDGTLFAQPFDADQGELSGEAKAIVDGVLYFFPNGDAAFDAAAATIAYRTPDPDDAPVWVDRTGVETGAVGPPGLYAMVSISPDGRRAIVYQRDRRLGTGDLWLRDLASQTLTRLTNDEFSERRVVWSPDGRSIAYSSDRDGPPDVYVLDLDGGPPRLVYRTATVDDARAWLHGGRLLVTSSGLGSRVVGLDGTVDESVDLPRQVNSASPDGAWITSVASSGSLNEITIAPFGRTGAPVVVSAGGGQNPIWARDSRSLYYHTDRSIFVVRNMASPASGQFVASPPELVLTISREIGSFDVTPDGKRFILLRLPPRDFLRVQVIVNWPALLR
jgi:serine/threonine protein kinase/dipeptidyl aminopeptidase/acylaminoacyl peptidase